LNKPCELFASVISDNPRDVFSNLRTYEDAKISGIHFDMMDGNFVPRFGLYPEMLKEIRNLISLPIEVHLMTSNFEKYLSQISELGANRIIFHIEATDNLENSIKKVKELGTEVGIAINPNTNLEFVGQIANEIDYVMLMAITPGIPKHPFIESTYKKIADLKKILILNSSIAKIGIDGGVTFDNARDIYRIGADVLICGSGTFFDPTRSLKNNITLLQKTLS
jgi:ribulose-phosphate 3-epimerase